MEIKSAESDVDIQACFPVMVQLRTHLKEGDFVEQVRRQQRAGYHLVFVEDDGVVRAVAGFHIGESLSWGRFFYVDDFVTNSDDRSKGFGSQLFDWLAERGRSESCAYLHLDSGVHRVKAHRFYYLKGMAITGHHLSLSLET